MRSDLSRRAALIGGVAALAPIVACAQKRKPVIGYLEPIAGDSPTNAINVEAFRKGLAEHGFVEGRNIAVEYRYAAGDIDRLPALAAELVQRGVDVIVASTPNAARAAMALTTTIPIVFGQAADAVENGEVKNLARPEANLTGVANFNELNPKRFQILSQWTPNTTLTAYISDPNLGSFARNLRQLEEAAAALNRPLLVLKAATDSELEAAFQTAAQQNTGAVMIGPVRGAYSRPRHIVGLASQREVPVMYYDRAFVDVGGLMSYGAAFKRIYYLVGTYVGRILKGAKVADLPVQQPNSYELVVNAGLARKQGLKVPPAVLAAADEIIE